MTLTQLLHLAELCDDAAGWATDPEWSWKWAQAAEEARSMAADPTTGTGRLAAVAEALGL